MHTKRHPRIRSLASSDLSIELVFMQAISMFLVVYAISTPMDEELSHNLSILGTLLYVCMLFINMWHSPRIPTLDKLFSLVLAFSLVSYMTWVLITIYIQNFLYLLTFLGIFLPLPLEPALQLVLLYQSLAAAGRVEKSWASVSLFIGYVSKSVHQLYNLQQYQFWTRQWAVVG